jgi:hypothetical protein
MGYTHYWRRPATLPRVQFATWASDVGLILRSCDAKIVDYSGDPGTTPEVTPEFVSFNGEGNDGYESFLIERIIEAPLKEFCKTGRDEGRPYDEAVTACLIRLAHHMGDRVKVESDGSKQDWAKGLTLCRTLFGGAKLPKGI